MLSIRFYYFTLLHSSVLILSVQAESYACDEQIYSLLNISEQDPEKGSALNQWKLMLMKHL
jgi:hypothetical protein